MGFPGLYVGIPDSGPIYFEDEFSELIAWDGLPIAYVYRSVSIPEKELRPVIHYDQWRNPIVNYEGPRHRTKERPRIKLFRLRTENGQRRFKDAEDNEYYIEIETK